MKALSYLLATFLIFSTLIAETSSEDVWNEEYKFEEGYKYATIDCKYYIEILEQFETRECPIYVNFTDENVFFQLPETLNDQAAIYLEDEGRNDMVSYLEKSLKWQAIALKKKEMIEKLIGKPSAAVYSYMGNVADEIYVKFFSQSDSHHQVLLQAVDLNTIYLEFDQVQILIEVLSDKGVKAGIKDAYQYMQKLESYK